MSAQRMSNADAAWLHMDRPTNLMVVNALLFFDEPLDIERTREVVRTRLVERFPRFRRRIAEPRLGIGLPSWEDDPAFDLDLHVHRLALPAPSDKAELQALVGDLVVRPLDRARPLWDMYAIEGYCGGTAVLTRMHHCIADGIALARVLLSLTDSQPDAGLAPPAAEHGDGTPLSAVTGAARAGAHAADAALHESAALVAHPRPECPADRGRDGERTRARQAAADRRRRAVRPPRQARRRPARALDRTDRSRWRSRRSATPRVRR